MMSELFDKALLVRDNADLKQRIKELTEQLDKVRSYTHHSSDCGWHYKHAAIDCNCGLQQALGEK